jgi:hypothetical protein
MNSPSVVRGVRSETFAMPRSTIATRSSFASSTLAGLRSRCTIPAACSAASPPASWRPTSRSSASGNGPSADTASRSDWPSTSSTASHARGAPATSATPSSSVAATFRCRTRRPTSASRRNRSRNPGRVIRCGWTTLTAARSPIPSASHTEPIPPSPRCETSRRPPSTTPARSSTGAAGMSGLWTDTDASPRPSIRRRPPCASRARPVRSPSRFPPRHSERTDT